jgi:hypothetical protein
MRQETNNEIDLLLRRLSQRQGGSVSDADLHVESDHLDADELSSYAENALPAAARMRYTEHLADCSKCRELVVQLSASVPVVAAKDTVTAPEPSGLRRFLASFFSPMVLRYAVPAMGLIVVAAIGFIAFRSNQPRPDVALSTQATPPASPVPGNDPQQSSGFYDSPTRTESQPPVTNEQKVEGTGNIAGQRPAPQSTPTPSTSDTAKTDRAEFMKEPAAANAAPPPTQQAPKPAATVDEMSVEVQARRPTEQTSVTPAGDLAKQKTADAVREQEKKAEDLRAAQGRGEAASPQAGRGIASVRRRDALISKDGVDTETRSAGGREFRRQNGVWVDTAYNAGSAVVNIARDSEQYRSLVADEPGIKTIADQLPGPIIVVWKGRTYRIR